MGGQGNVREGFDFAAVVGAHFYDHQARLRRCAKEGQRDPNVVVQIPLGGVDVESACKHIAQEFLGGGFSIASRQTEYWAIPFLSNHPGKLLHGVQDVVDDGGLWMSFPHPIFCDDVLGAKFQGLRDKIIRIKARSLERPKHLPIQVVSGVDGRPHACTMRFTQLQHGRRKAGISHGVSWGKEKPRSSAAGFL